MKSQSFIPKKKFQKEFNITVYLNQNLSFLFLSTLKVLKFIICVISVRTLIETGKKLNFKKKKKK